MIRKKDKIPRHSLRFSTINYDNSVNSDIKFNITTDTFNINQLDILIKMHAPEDGNSTWWMACNKVIIVTISGGFNNTANNILNSTPGAKIINVFRAWIGAQLTICAQK